MMILVLTAKKVRRRGSEPLVKFARVGEILAGVPLHIGVCDHLAVVNQF